MTVGPIQEALRLAIDTGDVRAVERMVADRPDLLSAIVRPGRNRDYRPLTEAAVACQLEVLSLLIAAGCDVCEDHHYPLFRTALYDRCVPALEMLVRHGAPVDGVWNDYGPPLLAACEGMAPECLKWLLAHGARVAGAGPGATRVVTWNAVLDAAAFHKGCPALLELVLEHGGGVNSQGCDGTTALHVAARKGDAAGVRLLLERGADPGVCDQSGRRPVDVTRNRRVVRLLDEAL